MGSQGVRQAMDYAFRGTCDSHLRAAGAEALAGYSEVDEAAVIRFTVHEGAIDHDELDAEQLALWVDGCDPLTGERRGRLLSSVDADLVLDSTLNAPKSISIGALLHPDLSTAYEALQDRLRDRVLRLWQAELNARRGAGGRVREPLARVEAVELRHRRSRALDPHVHRHLWLNVRVQGEDGRWSNVDSRVAMRMQTLVNAEGDLATRTDPGWIRALAAHGYSMNADGEIAELAHLVRPLSRRSNQIEANRAVLLARWRAEHPGQHPGHEVLRQIDRYAWAAHRPDKPDSVDEDEWAAMIMEELRRLDPHVLDWTSPPDRAVRGSVPMDRDLLARQAVVEADDRSKSSSGRFSALDLRAGATRAVARSGLVSDRNDLQAVIDDVTARALSYTRDLLPDRQGKPQHVKALVTRAFAARKTQLGQHLTALSCTPTDLDDASAAESVAGDPALGGSQQAAVTAIASSHRLVTVTGPAGTGKTTLLRAAREALAGQRRHLVVVAPTRKAAAVAGREVGVPSTSIHALLADYGWRWRTDDAGAELWWRLRPGEVDAITGARYSGSRMLRVDAATRIVVDEAGMLDLNAANALTLLAVETGAGVAMIGDPLQASPIGHAGAMALASRRAGCTVELIDVHRFTDPAYAALTLRLRNPGTVEKALQVAADLQAGGHVHRVHDLVEAHEMLVDGYFQHRDRGRTVAIVTGSNEEARDLSEGIQEARVARGQLTVERVAVGAGEQRLLEGDVVQTRRNDRITGVQNRALWTISRIGPAAIELQRHDDSADVRVVPPEYAAEFLQLAYATTVHGIQGETTDVALVGPGVTAAGLYVGLTRGRHVDEAIVVAHTDEQARERIAEQMIRGIPDTDLDDATRTAARDLAHSAHDPTPEPLRTSTAGRVLAALTAWLLAARAAILRTDADTANTAARRHARPALPAAGGSMPDDVRVALDARIRAAEAAEAEAFDRYLHEHDTTRSIFRDTYQDEAAPAGAAVPKEQGRRLR